MTDYIYCNFNYLFIFSAKTDVMQE